MEGFIMEFIKDAAAIAGLILSLSSVIVLCSKGGRKLISYLMKTNITELQQADQEQNERIERIETSLSLLNQKVDTLNEKYDAVEKMSMQQCRDVIKNIYYNYEKQKKIPLYERKTADAAYELYTNTFHGNSYAKLLYEEICKWPIDTVNYTML